MSNRPSRSCITACLCFTALSLDVAAANFPGLQMTAPGWGPLATDTGHDSTLKFYGSVDAYIDTYDSGSRSGTRLAGGGAWTNKVGVFARTPVTDDMSVVIDIEEGFNFDGDALSRDNSTWQDVGRLRLAMVGLRSKTWGKLDVGKTYGVTAPTMLDPFLGPAKLSPFSSLSFPVATAGSYYVDMRPKHTIVYTTPRFQGWSLSSALSFNYDSAASSGREIRGGGMRLDYVTPTLMLISGYSRYWSDPYTNGRDREVQTANDYYFASLAYDLGPLSLSAAWQRQVVDTEVAPELNVVTLGAMLPVGKDLARAVVVNRRVQGRDNDAWGFMVGYDHFFNPRTAVYVRAGLVVNQAEAGQTLAAIPLEDRDDTPQDLAVGFYYHF
ncbi:porin [Pseudomonas sp. BN505]|uniref:porin n=1 Tax=unclassified Pseudomonas TaxID=196821 RepID=UPI002453C1D6|nr:MULTISPECIES: porin [unclassified Pseudomonas]MDH4842264.1 porin [Pseudomonas sp. BN605]MDH4855119.1 porin [Pseudomonas sp. BN505]